MNAVEIEEIVRLWGLSGLRLIADTQGSIVYRADDVERGSVVVKLLKPQGMSELPGMDYLEWRNGIGAVRLIRRHTNAALLEDAGTRSLEELRQRQGEKAATETFTSVLAQLHSPNSKAHPASLVPLERHFRVLIEHPPALLGARGDNVAWAADVARELLASQTGVMPLHGDLHHENILADDSGNWRAVDPHGLIGETVYDAANFFGNPIGRTEITCDPARILLLADHLAPALRTTRQTLLRYAAVHAALSACWSISDPMSDRDLRDAEDRLRFLDITRTLIG